MVRLKLQIIVNFEASFINIIVAHYRYDWRDMGLDSELPRQLLYGLKYRQDLSPLEDVQRPRHHEPNET